MQVAGAAHSIFVSQFGMGAAEEVQAWICEHDGHPFIELHLHQHAVRGEAPVPDTVIRIPATLLPELKRLVQGLEEQLTAQGLSDEFQTVEQLHLERGPMFAHPSEAEFAQMLDFYKIRWQYEPTTFPLQCDAQGRILESFTPDFYLPDQDLYIELTTQKQGLVIPDRFVVGYGLDYHQRYRNLPFIGVLKPEILEPRSRP